VRARLALGWTIYAAIPVRIRERGEPSRSRSASGAHAARRGRGRAFAVGSRRRRARHELGLAAERWLRSVGSSLLFGALWQAVSARAAFFAAAVAAALAVVALAAGARPLPAPQR
jgi:hypothetical protein